jgi:general secretion pathway protein K
MAQGQNSGACQRGVAVVTALLLTTLSITIVSSLFWQQQVQVRAIENQQLQLQKQWILRGALDWVNLLLREDSQSSNVDHLDEPWAVPLAATRLEDYLDKAAAGGTAAILTGSIVDAQSRYNLRNLAPDGTVDVREVAALRRLLTVLGLDPKLAQRTADLIASASTKISDSSDGNIPNRVSGVAKQVMAIEQIEDLLVLPGISPDVLDKLKDFIVLLPRPTPINVNTASPQVLAARIEALSAEDVSSLVASRGRAYIRDEGDLNLRLQGKVTLSLEKEISLSTNYFLVNAKVDFNRGSLEMQALMARSLMTGAQLVWTREY